MTDPQNTILSLGEHVTELVDRHLRECLDVVNDLVNPEFLSDSATWVEE